MKDSPYFTQVICLKGQRYLLWSGFIICLLAQLIVLLIIKNVFSDFDKHKTDVAEVLVFFPCLTFGVMADLQAISSTWDYKPIAFSEMPNRWSQKLMLAIGFVSLGMSVISYILCLLVYGGYIPDLRRVMFACFMVKAFTWSPFLGMEFYDLVFEQIYHDVNFQINVIKPNSVSPSPAGKRKPKITNRMSEI